MKQRVLFAFCVALLASLCHVSNASSIGITIPSYVVDGCNADSPKLGCLSGWNETTDPMFFNMTPMIRGACLDSTPKWMDWTGAAKPTTVYSVRTGDGMISDDLTQYTPGEYVNIYVRITAAFNQYKGLLLYAVNSTVNCTQSNFFCKVGDWIVPNETVMYFGTYPRHQCKRSVMHTTSTNKRILSIFTFQAPPEGTGPITFKLLFKVGNPNPTPNGDFLYPAKDLKLTERPLASNIANNWISLPVGTTCSSYCTSKGSTCMVETLEHVYLPDLVRSYPCHPAVFQECSDGSSAGTDDDVCSVHLPASSCASPRYVAPSCAVAATNETAVFCACGDYKMFMYRDKSSPTAAVPTYPPSIAPDPDAPNAGTPLVSAAQRPHSSALALLGSVAMAGMSRPGPALLMLAMAWRAQSHNFLEGFRGRAPFASTIAPTFPQLNKDVVHLQVAQNQEFTVEWANAHVNPTYWVVLHAEDEKFLKKHTTVNLDDYLKNCPTNASLGALGRNARFHVTPPNFNISWNQMIVTSRAPSTIFDSVANLGDADYFNRDQDLEWNSSIKGSCGGGGPQYIATTAAACSNKTLQVRYQQQWSANDMRCAYASTKYPWIEEVARYAHPTFTPLAATAAFKIAGRKGPGRYQMHWLWAAFRDTVDIDLRPQAEVVLRPWGVKGPANVLRKYGKADHCFFENAVTFGSSCIAVPPEDTVGAQCRAKCDASTTCRGYALVPLSSPDDPRVRFHEESPIPWNGSTYQTASLKFATRNNPNCLRDQFVGLPPETLVCYTVTTFQDDRAGTLLPWKFDYDTESSGFYSTCFVKSRNVDFEYSVSAPVPPNDPAPFRFGATCVPCEDYNANSTSVVDNRWRVTGMCSDCVKFPRPARAAVATVQNSSANLAFDGGALCSGKLCYKWLSPAGSPIAYTEPECSSLVKGDVACSSTMMFASTRALVTAAATCTDKSCPSGNVLSAVVAKFGAWSRDDLVNKVYRNCACWLNSSGTPVLAAPSTTGFLNATGYLNGSWSNFKVYRVA